MLKRFKSVYSKPVRNLLRTFPGGEICNRRQLCDKGKETDTENKPKIRKTSNTNPVDNTSGIQDDLLGSLQQSPIETDFPSDLDLFDSTPVKRHQASKSVRSNLNPEMTSIVQFPGQGSQFIGMGKELLPYPGVKELYEQASEILGYDLLKLCLSGPTLELDKTVHCQPAIFVTSIAAVEKLREDHPGAVESCVSTAGFSVGEYAALVFAGAMSFEDALKVVKLRAEKMQEASEEVSSGMMSIFLFADTNLKQAMLKARKYCETRLDIERPICNVANYLFTQCKVVAGHTEALEFLKMYGREYGIRAVKQLPVSGAFHTVLMNSARKPVEEALKKIDIHKPRIPVYSNVTCTRYKDAKHIVKLLGEQIIKPVKWEQILHAVYERETGLAFPKTYEVGPDNQLGRFLAKTNTKAYLNYQDIKV